MSIPAMIHGPSANPTGVTFYIGNQPYQAHQSLPSFAELLIELKMANPDVQKMIRLTEPVQDIVKAVEAAVQADYLPAGVVSVTRSEVRYNGDPIGGVLVERILDMLANGYDIMPMIRFMENLYRNPTEWTRDELYFWLENSDLPITEDGYFLAYKMVNADFTSQYDGKTDNTPGKIVSMPRDKVDADRESTCSRGLHFCSLGYLPNYGGSNSGTIVLLKINPADVVSIPNESGNHKGRAWRYEVLSKFKGNPHTKKWAPVTDALGDDYVTDPNDQLLDVTTDLGKALFGAVRDIGIIDRKARLFKAASILGMAPSSFSELTVGQASKLLEALRTEKAVQDAAADQKASTAVQKATEAAATARRAQIEAINGYGIIQLRKKASTAGYQAVWGQSAWKGPKADQLRRFLISKV